MIRALWRRLCDYALRLYIRRRVLASLSEGEREARWEAQEIRRRNRLAR